MLLEQLLAEGRAAGTVRLDVNPTDIRACGAWVSQPLRPGPTWEAIARRHVKVFVDGLRAAAGAPLPGPAVTVKDIEAAFRADASA